MSLFLVEYGDSAPHKNESSAMGAISQEILKSFQQERRTRVIISPKPGD